MSPREKLLNKVLGGRSDSNIPFDGLCTLLKQLGFEEHIRGGHHIFVKANIDEIMNLQPKNAKAKPYQVKQVRMVIIKYKLGEETDD